MKCPEWEPGLKCLLHQSHFSLRHNNLIDPLLNSCDQPGKHRTVLYSLSEPECFPGTSVIPPLSSTQLINAVIDKWWLPDSSLLPSPGPEGGAQPSVVRRERILPAPPTCHQPARPLKLSLHEQIMPMLANGEGHYTRSALCFIS